MKISDVTIPKATDLALQVKPDTEDAEKVESLVNDFEIETNQDLNIGTKFLAKIKNKHKEIDQKRLSWTSPLLDVIEDINTFFRPALTALLNAEKVIKEKVAGCVEVRFEKRDQLLETVALASEESRDEKLEQADELLPPKIKGLSFREKWIGKITDSQAVMKWAIENERLELLKVDEKALKALTNSTGTDPKIPGWLVQQSRTVVITPSKVE